MTMDEFERLTKKRKYLLDSAGCDTVFLYCCLANKQHQKKSVCSSVMVAN